MVNWKWAGIGAALVIVLRLLLALFGIYGSILSVLKAGIIVGYMLGDGAIGSLIKERASAEPSAA
jgi:hypothetical protein